MSSCGVDWVAALRAAIVRGDARPPSASGFLPGVDDADDASDVWEFDGGMPVDDAADVRALLVASSVRFVLLPLVGVLGSLALRAANSPWYPSDPVVAMVGLTMSAMPPAQNMVLLTNLNERTRHLAPRVGGMLVRMYVLAVVPCTVWLTVFKAAVMA